MSVLRTDYPTDDPLVPHWFPTGAPLVPHSGSGNRNSQKQVVRLCRVPLEFQIHLGMLADGTYLVPEDFTNFRDGPRDVRQVPEPPYCADLATGAPLAPHWCPTFRHKSFDW